MLNRTGNKVSWLNLASHSLATHIQCTLYMSIQLPQEIESSLISTEKKIGKRG